MTGLIEAIPWRDMALVLVFVLTVAITGFVKEWWVMGGRFREMRDERNFYRHKFFDTLGVAEKAAEIAAKEVGL